MLTKIRLIGVFLSLGFVATPFQVQSQTLLARQVPNLPPPNQYLPSVPRADRIELSLSQRKVRVFQDNLILKQYPVAVGKPGWETPVGTFEIKTMVVDPAWKHPFDGYVVPSGDPENPLGRRWMGFWTDGENWVGFHGTSDSMRPSIGSAASHGCVRMFEEDIQAMFELVAIGTPVIVTP